MLQDDPPVPTLSVGYASALDAPAVVFVFDAGAAITQPSVSSFPTAGLTIAFWVQTTNTTTGVVLVSYDANPPTNPHRLWIKSPANLEIGIGAQSTGATGVSVADGAWHHVAVTLTQMNATQYAVSVYKDGIRDWLSTFALTGTLESLGDFVVGQGVSGEPGFTGQMSEFRLLNVAESPATIATQMQVRLLATDPSAVFVWVLTSAQTSGQITGSHAFSPSTPPLAYRINRALVASFSQVTSATYDLQWSASDRTYYPLLTGLPWAPVPLSGFQINTRYSASVRAVVSGQAGPWSAPVSATTLELGQPIADLRQPAAAQVQVFWGAVDQTQLYALAFYKDGGTNPVSPSGTQTGTTFDLTPLVTGTDTWTYTIASTSTGATGPLTPVVPVTAPALTFTYDWATAPGVLQASWPATDRASYRYLTVTLQGTTSPVAAPLLPAATLSYNVATTVALDQTYTAQVRALQAGAIGAWSSSVIVVIHQLIAPVIGRATSDGTAHTITVSWTSPAGPATQQSVAELWTGDLQTRLAVIEPATSSQVFQNSAIVNGASFQVRVRSTADHSYGEWSAWSAVAVNGLPQVTGVTARSNTTGDVTVSWTAITGITGVMYVANITGPGDVNYTSDAVSDNTVTLLRSQTHVLEQQTYNVTVQARADGRTPGPWSAPQPVTTGQIGPYPPEPHEVQDPIDSGSGAFIFRDDLLSVSGVMPMTFSIAYSSRVPIASENPMYPSTPIGNRFTHSFNARIARDPDGTMVYVLWGNLFVEAFGVPGSTTGYYVSSGASAGTTLFLGTDLIFTLTRADQRRYHFSNDGRLLSAVDRFGHRTTYAYAGSLLQSVTDEASGQALTFTYAGGYLQQVSDASGRHVSLTYDGGNLKQVTDVMGHPVVFAYTGASFIETIVDARGNTAVKNIYTNGQVTFQQDARALATQQSYGTTLSYQNQTIGGVPMVVTTVTDRAGHAIAYQTLASNGALVNTQYDLGQGHTQVESRTYDAFNNILTETIYIGSSSAYTAGAGNTTTYTYDGGGNQLTATTPLGAGNVRVLTSTYDASNNLRTSTVYEGAASGYTATAGNTTRYDYYPDNTLKSVTDPLNRTIALTYQDGAIPGLVKAFTDAMGNVFTCTYQGAYLQKVVNPFNEQTVYERDAIGRLTRTTIVDANGVTAMTSTVTYYDSSLVKSSSFQVAGQADADAYVVSYAYDNNGNLSTVTRDGQATAYGSNPNNFPSGVTYPTFRGATRTTQIDYDRDDYLQSIAYATLPLVRQTYTSDVLGRMQTYQDPNQRVYGYGRTMITGGSSPLPFQETTTWPALAAAPGVTYTDRSTRDALGRVTSVTDRSGNTTDITYTAVPDGVTGTRRLQVLVTLPPATTGGTRYTITYLYDAIGRQIAVTDQNGRTSTLTYSIGTDPVSQTKTDNVTQTDPLGNQDIRAYDALGRWTQWTVGQPAASQPLSRTRTFQYDALSRLAQVVETQGTSSTTSQIAYAYDTPSRAIVATIGRPGQTTGQTLQSYNGVGQLVKQVDPFGATTICTYAPWGALATFQNGRGQVLTYNFDPAGRLIGTTYPDSSVLTQTLDANGNRRSTQLGTNPAIVREFDEWNRMLLRTTPSLGTVGYAYWPTDQVKTLTYSDQKKVQYAIDGLQRLQQVADWANRSATYTYRPTGQVAGISFPNGGAAHYSYDDANRLTGIAHAAGGLVVAQWGVVLNVLGEPSTATAVLPLPPVFPTTGQTLTYTTGNQIATSNGSTYTYDNDGQWIGLANQTAIAEYDIYGHLTALHQPTEAQFTYDGDGLRIGATIGGSVSNYLFDVNGYQDAAVERGDPARALVAVSFAPTIAGVIGPWPISAANTAPTPPLDALDRLLEVRDDQQQILHRVVHGLGVLWHEGADGTYQVLHDDMSGNIVALTGSAGALLDRSNYDPFGQSLGRSGASFNPFTFGGRYGVLDAGNGFLHMRNRAYATAQMRFLQPDYFLGAPYRPQTLNRYAYVAGNPLQGIDPLGLDTWKIGLGVGLGVLGLAGLGGLGYYLYQSGAFGAIGSWFSSLGARLGGGSGPRYVEIPMDDFPVEPDVPPRTPPRVPSGRGFPDAEWTGVRQRFPFSERPSFNQSATPSSQSGGGTNLSKTIKVD